MTFSPLLRLARAIPALPRSLVGRVFTVFSLTLLLSMGTGLGLFYRYQFLQHIEETQDTALTLVEVATQTIEDSVVIGNFERNAFRPRRDAGIAGRRIEAVQQGGGRDLPCQGMLAAAGADQENIHGCLPPW